MSGLIDRIKSAESLVKLTLGLLAALVPAAAMLRGVVDIPPDVDDLIVYISGGLGLAVAFCVFLGTERIDAMARRWIILICVAGVGIGAVSATAYYSYANSHIVSVPYGDRVERVVVPGDPSPELAELIGHYDGDWVEALKTGMQKERIAKLIAQENLWPTVTIIVLMIAAQALMTLGLLVPLWKLAAKLRKPDEP